MCPAPLGTSRDEGGGVATIPVLQRILAVLDDESLIGVQRRNGAEVEQEVLRSRPA